MLLTLLCQEGQTGCSPATLRERCTERRKCGGITLNEVIGEGVWAFLEVDDGLIKVRDNPPYLKSHRCTVRGFENDLAGKLCRRTTQVTWDSETVLFVGHLREWHYGTRLRIAELPEGIVVVDGAAYQVAVLIIETGRVLVELVGTEDFKGAPASGTGKASVRQWIGHGASALADRAVSDGLAGFERRWRWVQRLLCSGMMDRDKRECKQRQHQYDESARDTEEFHDEVPFERLPPLDYM